MMICPFPASKAASYIVLCILKDHEIYVKELVQMWIAEGVVRSKQGSHLTDMAIGRSYVNLLVDRCLFQNVSNKDRVCNPYLH